MKNAKIEKSDAVQKVPWMGFRRVNKITNESSLCVHIALSKTALLAALKRIEESEQLRTVLVPVDTKFLSPEDTTLIEIYDDTRMDLKDTCLGSHTRQAEESKLIINP